MANVFEGLKGQLTAMRKTANQQSCDVAGDLSFTTSGGTILLCQSKRKASWTMITDWITDKAKGPQKDTMSYDELLKALQTWLGTESRKRARAEPAASVAAPPAAGASLALDDNSPVTVGAMKELLSRMQQQQPQPQPVLALQNGGDRDNAMREMRKARKAFRQASSTQESAVKLAADALVRSPTTEVLHMAAGRIAKMFSDETEPGTISDKTMSGIASSLPLDTQATILVGHFQEEGKIPRKVAKLAARYYADRMDFLMETQRADHAQSSVDSISRRQANKLAEHIEKTIYLKKYCEVREQIREEMAEAEDEEEDDESPSEGEESEETVSDGETDVDIDSDGSDGSDDS